jgi:transcriptional regulator with XRE-family HTH domain
MQLEKSFGETIRDLRTESHLTLREVAEHLKIDTSMLGKIEKNNRNPSKQFINDTVAYSILEEELATEVLKVAEEKINYYNKNKANK